MKLFKKSIYYKKLFTSYIIILLIPVIAVSILYLWQTSVSRKSTYQQSYMKASEMLQKSTEKIFSNIDTVSYNIRHSTWLTRAYSNSQAMNKYFFAATKADIYKQMTIYDCLIEVTDETTVVLTQKNSVINKNGWYDLDTYLDGEWSADESIKKTFRDLLQNADYYSVLNLNEKGIKTKNKCEIILMQNLDVPNNTRAVLLVPLSINRINEHINLYSIPQLVGFDIVFEGSPFYTYKTNQKAKNIFSIEMGSKNLPYQYKMYYNMDCAKLSFKDYLFVAFMAAILAAFVTVLARFLAKITYKPLNHLMDKLSSIGESDIDLVHEFMTIENIFNGLAAQRDELSEIVTRYYDTARNNILINLISGYFKINAPNAELSRYEIRFDEASFYRVAIISISPENENDSRRIQAFLRLRQKLSENKELCLETLEDASGHLIIIFKSSDENQNIMLILSSSIKDTNDKLSVNLNYSLGSIENGLLGISRSYQNAKETTFGRLHSNEETTDSYYYPTDWEMQLINYLKIGNATMSKKIIEELRFENHKRNLPQHLKIRLTFLIMQTLIRVVDELNFGISDIVFDFNGDITILSSKKQWEHIEKAVIAICDRTGNKNDSKIINLGRQMMNYIEDNYSNASLSLQSLSDKFNVSVSSASRIFKSVVKIKFGDYLCRIRMEKAKEYFRNADFEINKVASLVGYDSDTSFRRAFLRYEGITPSEYIKNHNI